MNNKENYVSRQISVYKTGKALIEFNDKLNTAPEESYAHIHAKGEDLFGVKQYSLIGIVMLDYSGRMGEQCQNGTTSPKGTGENAIRVTANISPEQAQYIFSKVQIPVKEFYFSADKIFGVPDKDGYCQMTKLTIQRKPTGADGKPSRYPWQIFIENGKGKQQKTEIGGIAAQKGSYVCIAKAGIYINDEDFFGLFCRVDSFIRVWENAYGCKLVKDGRNMFNEIMAEKNKKNVS